MSAECVDLSNLREAIGQDPDLERELFEEFITSSAALCAELEKHCKGESDNEAWRSAAHAMKGISANLGAGPLATLCKKGQEGFEQSQSSKMDMLAEIKEEHKRVLDYLNSQA